MGFSPYFVYLAIMYFWLNRSDGGCLHTKSHYISNGLFFTGIFF